MTVRLLLLVLVGALIGVQAAGPLLSHDHILVSHHGHVHLIDDGHGHPVDDGHPHAADVVHDESSDAGGSEVHLDQPQARRGTGTAVVLLGLFLLVATAIPARTPDDPQSPPPPRRRARTHRRGGRRTLHEIGLLRV